MTPHVQGPRPGHARVFLPERSGGAVAGVGEDPPALFAQLLVQLLEPRSRMGSWRIVRMFDVTSSPVRPSPRVAPRVNTPSS